MTIAAKTAPVKTLLALGALRQNRQGCGMNLGIGRRQNTTPRMGRAALPIGDNPPSGLDHGNWRANIIALQPRLHHQINLACRKRSVEQERIDQLVSSIQRQVETSGDTEVPSGKIGEMVMDGLKKLDSVAYIRFASVYKDFREAKDFEDFAGSVVEAAKT